MRWPIITRRQYEHALRERDEHQQAAISFARQLRDLKETQARRMSRITRLQKGVARARTQATGEKRRADQLQARLDDALGLNAAAVLDGRYWQQTRHDKKGVAS